MKTEKQKMLAGELYDASDVELVRERRSARMAIHELNNCRPSDEVAVRRIVSALFGSGGDSVWLEPR